ncbi:glycerophosphodiester phosphodiesterase [Jeotgalibacillus soli]|uniref:Glycerophosphoryl diester phosphodiesterase n=1 Tax=Jeotgalibacillus soli TaxID=889306 RepID=A0A0C2R4D8_9BACL|nr:glycerophosphodiester phosphodiesterase [Jeotgalibacillus soli]KIL45100.1 glycerophosphoryl diester phosphodiesterase [Jeotgalibacillus soli]
MQEGFAIRQAEIEIFGHRGASGHFPENTLIAFQETRIAGANGIELDVQMSKDRQLIVMHDETIDRTTNGSGYIKDMTYEILKALDAGSWFHSSFSNEKIITLDEVLEWATGEGNHLTINIELKNDQIFYDGLEEAVLNLVQQYHLEDRVIISSFNPKSLQKVRSLHKTIDIGYLIEGKPPDTVEIAKQIGANAIHCQEVFALSEKGQTARAEGLLLRVYTVNDTNAIERLKHAEVSVIMTDYPAEFVKSSAKKKDNRKTQGV